MAMVRNKSDVGRLGRLIATTLLVAGLLGAIVTTDAKAREVLTLDVVVDLAARHAPTVIEAEASLRDLELERDRAAGAFGTNLGLSGNVTSKTGEVTTIATAQANGTLAPGLTWSARTGTRPRSSSEAKDALSVSYQLWPPPRDASAWVNLDNAERRLAAYDQTLEASRAQAAIAAVDLYFRVQLAHERLRLAQEHVDATMERIKRLAARREVGTVSESERIALEIELLEKEEEAAGLQSQLDALADELAKALGLSRDSIALGALDEDGPAVGDPLADLPSQEAAVEAALNASGEARSRRLTVQSAQEALDIAVRNQGFGVSVGGGVESKTSGGYEWSVHVTGTYALSDGGARRRNVESARHALDKAETAYANTIATLQAQVRTALRALERGERSVEIKRGLEELRRLDVSVARQQVAIGFLAESDLAAKERALRAAVLDRIEAEVGLVIERLRLDLLMGKHPDFSLLGIR